MQDVETVAKPSRQALAIEGRSGRKQVSGKLKVALLAMIWSGARRTEAAATAGLQDHSLRAALKKPHVKAFYLAELGSLRTSERARNLHALVRVRDSDDNKMATVAAVKTLEQIDDAAEKQFPGGIPGAPRQPGLVIIVQTGQPGAPSRVIDGGRVTEVPARSLQTADRAVSDAEGPADGGEGFPGFPTL
jgi:hypothetical protein